MEMNELQNKGLEWQGEAQEAAQELGSKAKKKVADFKKTAQEWQRSATQSCRKAAKATDQYVHENPWTVIGSVGMAGLLLGLLLGRSRD